MFLTAPVVTLSHITITGHWSAISMATLRRRKNAFPNSYEDIMIAQAGATLITRGTIPEHTYHTCTFKLFSNTCVM